MQRTDGALSGQQAMEGYQTLRFGQDDEPLVVIDDFAEAQLPRLISLARQGRFAPVPGFPGARSPADPTYLGLNGEVLHRALAEQFGFDGGLRIKSCNYSIVALTPEQLSPEQRVPHYDDPGEELLAILHYLGDEADGGTAFYRHRRTGFETLRPDRVDAYHEALREDDPRFGEPAQAYCYGDSERFELTGEVAAKRDRLVIYRGRRLHSGRILHPPSGNRRDRVRLTLNTFALGVRAM